MPKGKYRGVSLSAEQIEAVEIFIKENPEQNYTSIADFIGDAVRRRLEEKRFEIFNHDANGVKVTDRKLRRIAQIYFKPEGIWCDLDGNAQCEHIDFVLRQPDIQENIRKKKKEGWKLPDV